MTVNIARGPAINLNASRAIFSDIIPATPAPGQPAFIFDPTNPWGCNSSFNIASQVATAAANNAAGYYLVRWLLAPNRSHSSYEGSHDVE